MKAKALLLLAAVALAPLASARIGENEPQLIARYGRPVEIVSPGKFLKFRKANVEIHVLLWNGTCHLITYIPAYSDLHKSFEGPEPKVRRKPGEAEPPPPEPSPNSKGDSPTETESGKPRLTPEQLNYLMMINGGQASWSGIGGNMKSNDNKLRCYIRDDGTMIQVETIAHKDHAAAEAKIAREKAAATPAEKPKKVSMEGF